MVVRKPLQSRLSRHFPAGAGCLLLALLLPGVSLPAGAEVYRWVDDQGRVHYGDSAPENQQSTTIDTSTENVLESGEHFSPEAIQYRQEKRAREARKARQEAQQRQREADRAAQQAKKAAERWRKEHCQRIGGWLGNVDGSTRFEPYRWDCPAIPRKYRQYLSQPAAE